MKANAKRSNGLICWMCGLLAVCLFALTSCGNKEQILQLANTDDFVQDLNPPFLDILWVVNTQTDMGYARPKLLPEAEKFFTRLDNSAGTYKMAFASVDMEINPGRLMPLDSPVILEKSASTNGLTPQQRTDYFRAILDYSINLSTGSEDRGLESAITILQNVFVPRPNVPLVVVFISDSEDQSPVANGADAVSHYEQKLLQLKNNNRSLLRVYSINYSTRIPNRADRTVDKRCATRFTADIDEMANYVGKYFNLARRFAADTAIPDDATGDLCQSFASKIDISGLRQKELAKRFTLSGRPKVSTLQVSVTRVATGEVFELPWSYEPATNEIVFETAPPEGTNIRATYFPGS